MLLFFQNRFQAGSFLLVVLLSSSLFALQDGLALTPPMGFNTWNYFKCERNSEETVLKMAHAMVEKRLSHWEGKKISLLEAGYRYVNLDDCWHGASRDADGKPTVDTLKFPHGMKWLADTIHALGLKIGIYSDAGYKTCAGHFGVFSDDGGYDSIDAVTYAEWGIDYLKHDWCFVDTTWASDPSAQYDNAEGAIELYSRMRDALKATGRDIVYSLCCWGRYKVPQWGDSIGHLWRTGGDIEAKWDKIIRAAYVNIHGYNSGDHYHLYQKPGAWNDADMMQIGNGNLTYDENKSHMDLWCIMATPMLLGNNLVKMNDSIFEIVSNREVIAVNQDSLGLQGQRMTPASEPIQIWAKRLRSPDTLTSRKTAVVIINNGSRPNSGTVKWAHFGEIQKQNSYHVRDLWKHEDIVSNATESFTVENIPSHGSVHLIFTQNNDIGIRQKKHLLSGNTVRLKFRKTAAGYMMYVPVPRCVVEIFNQKGCRINQYTTGSSAWYPLGISGFSTQVAIVRVTSISGKRLFENFVLGR